MGCGYASFHAGDLDWQPRREGDAPERHELAEGSVLVVQPGTELQLSNRGSEELRLFIVGAPPERGETTFLDTVE